MFPTHSIAHWKRKWTSIIKFRFINSPRTTAPQPVTKPIDFGGKHSHTRSKTNRKTWNVSWQTNFSYFSMAALFRVFPFINFTPTIHRHGNRRRRRSLVIRYYRRDWIIPSVCTSLGSKGNPAFPDQTRLSINRSLCLTGLINREWTSPEICAPEWKILSS